jgi:choline-sulfatase
MKTGRPSLPRATLALALLFSPLAPGEQPRPRPTGDHVLLVTIDDLNDWISCLSDEGDGRGHPQASTPHLDRLAQRGVLFTNAHCQAPICHPSRTSFLGGLRPSTTGTYGNRREHDADGILTPGVDVPWLPNRFRQAGYQTYAVGKIHHGGNRGLGEVLGPQTGQGPFPRQKMNVPPEVTAAGVWDYGAWPDLDEFTDWQIAHWTIEQIRKPLAAHDAPRFLSLGFYRPHVPLFAPKRWFDAAPKIEDIILAPAPLDDLDDLPAIGRRMASRVAFRTTTEWVMEEEYRMRELTQAYLATTSAMDHCLGEVIDALDRSAMADNTWIVVFSDHGWHLGEKQHIAKQTLWERSTRVPLIIVPPTRITDTPRGLRCRRPVELLDVYPTLLAATGIPAETSDHLLEGLSLIPWIQDPEAPRDRPAITTLYSGNHSLCDERFRYIRYADGTEELYDRHADPHEHDNLIDKVSGRPEIGSAIGRLSAWIPKQQAGEPDFVLPEEDL